MFEFMLDDIKTFLLVNTPMWLTLSVVVIGLFLLIGEIIADSYIPFTYRVLSRVVALILISFGCFVYGKQSVVVPEQKIIEKIVTQQQVITNTVVKYLKVKQQATEDNHEKIIEDITTKDDHMCVIPMSFVRVFNASTEDTVPTTTTGTDDSPTGIALSDVERTTVDNNEMYHQVANELSALQDWVNQQREINK